MKPLTGNIQHCSIVLLAAGRSARMGQPKLLLPYEGKSLLKHAADAALATGIDRVMVVTGAYREEAEQELKGYPVHFAYNENWEEGMSGSIKASLLAVQKEWPDTDGILFLVTDQPYVSSDLLLKLIQKQKEKNFPIAAAVYGETTGTPVLFYKSIFPGLMSLTGDTGARMILRQHADYIARVEFKKGNIDIDTKSDYERLVNP